MFKTYITKKEYKVAALYSLEIVTRCGIAYDLHTKVIIARKVKDFNGYEKGGKLD